MLLARLCQTGQAIGISIGAALAVLRGVVERGEKLEPPLDSRIVVSHFSAAFERLVVQNSANLRAPGVLSKAFKRPRQCCQLLSRAESGASPNREYRG